jgi:bifunctional UDP-N-acetylglucosamine pyrophosphorylase/glucosamine-1-phosphate N-acetyltransferase
VRAALTAVPDEAGELLVLSGDVPLITPTDLGAVLAARRDDDAAIAIATVFAADPAALGRVVRSEFGTVERIVEAKDATDDELDGNEINAGLYAFDLEWLRRRIETLAPSETTGELYLTELVRLAREDGRLVSAVAFDDDGRFDGINDRSQLAAAEWNLRVRRNEQHMRDGVTMRDPSTVYLDWDVQLAPDVTLEPNVILKGRTTVGEGTVIGAGSQLIDSTVGVGARVWASIVEASTIEDEAVVGPFSHLRPGSTVGRGAEVGNFAELKNTRLGAGSKQHHMSYLGDAEIGERANIGAGAITANYDGTRKHRTTIGDGAFIGVDTMIVAPRDIGDGARTGAGAVVTRDVPAGKLAVGVPARIREPRAKPPASPAPSPASAAPSEPADGDAPS